LGWINKELKHNATKLYKIKFDLSENYVNEVEIDVVLLDVCGVMFGSTHIYKRDTILTRRENQYYLIKDINSLVINAQKCKSNISLAVMSPFLGSLASASGDDFRGLCQPDQRGNLILPVSSEV
jgi:hypothetical protein